MKLRSESPDGHAPAFPGHWSAARKKDWAISLLIIAATFIAYLPCLRGQFVWDDDSWTTMLFDQMQSVGGLVSMWTHPTVLQQYYPLSATTFWIDYQIWGFWTTPYHIENVLLHGVAAVMFWRLLRKLEVQGALLAAAIFAVHPVMVESAAWITERKNVLSMVLYLGAVLAYGRFVNFWTDGPADAAIDSKDSKFWHIALGLGIAALLAKTTAFSLPPALLLLCWWKRGRIRWREDVVPTLPFFAVAITAGLGITWLEKHHVGSHGPEWEIPFLERCLIAGRALWFYVGKLLWPAQLCFVYPRWHLDASSLAQWIFPIAAVGILPLLWLARNRIGRGPLVAALFYGGSLFPFLGFMNGYFMRYSFVSDHWVYLPSLSLIALFAAGLFRLAQKLQMPAMTQGFAIAAVPILGALTWTQCTMYSDIIKLYTTTLERNPAANLARNNLGQVYTILNRVDEAIPLFEDAVALEPKDPIYHNNLGYALLQKNRLDEAAAELRRAIALKPGYAKAHFTLGDLLMRRGKTDEAMAEFRKAIEADPTYAEAYVNLGAIALQRGLADEATAYFQKAVDAQPKNALAHNNLGEMLMRKGRVEDGIMHFKMAIDLRPEDPVFRSSLATVYLQQGQLDLAIPLLMQAVQLKSDYTQARLNLGLALSRVSRVKEAIAQFEKVLELSPDNAEAHVNLGIAYFRSARAADAIAHLQKAVDLQPNDAEARNNLAWVYASCPDPAFRNGAKAIELAQEAVRLSGGTNAGVTSTLAAAYAESGRYPEAVTAAQKAIDLATAQNNTALLQTLRQQIALYEAGRPLRPRGQTNAPATGR